MEIENIWGYIANKRMTMKQFCHKLEITPAYFSRIINGKAKASPQLAKRAYEKSEGILKLPFTMKKRHASMSENDFWAA